MYIYTHIYMYIYICIYIYIYIYILYIYISNIDSANPSLTDRFPVFYLSFECCQSCNVLYFVRYGIPDFRSKI